MGGGHSTTAFGVPDKDPDLDLCPPPPEGRVCTRSSERDFVLFLCFSFACFFLFFFVLFRLFGSERTRANPVRGKLPIGSGQGRTAKSGVNSEKAIFGYLTLKSITSVFSIIKIVKWYLLPTDMMIYL